ncbi:MAG: copper chaperone PCu(A)C [Ardenticatenaceae bacterium]|nr:copper chaperone PCu(A)C [Ardenticatenaceae bacterium]
MKKVIFLLAVLLITAVACGGGDEETITVTDPWGRTSPMAAENGAFYMTLNNNSSSDDALVSAATDACATVELHEMYDKGDGVMGMRPVEGGSITVPAGSSAELKPGGLHVMCLGKEVDFTAGTEIPLTLTFENAGEMEVTAVIRDN